MVWLMPLLSQNPIISCVIYIRTGLTCLVPADPTQVVLEKGPLNGCSVHAEVVNSPVVLHQHVICLYLFISKNMYDKMARYNTNDSRL